MKRIEHKIDLSFDADFREALKFAQNAFTMKNHDHLRAFAIQAASRLNIAQEIYKDYTITAFDNQKQVADEYLYCLFLACVAEILCYSNLEEIAVAHDFLKNRMEKIFCISIAILNDSTRYQEEPGNADPEALPRFSRGSASGH